MKMSPRETALRDHLGPELKGRTLSDARQQVSLTDILEHSCLGDRLGELSGRSVVLSTSDQITSVLAMIELDVVVTDHPEQWSGADGRLIVQAQCPAKTAAKARTERATEWLMLTSGTSG